MKKHIPIIALCCLLASLGFSQTLMQMRCYFDGNEGAAQYFAISNVADLDQPFVIDVSAIPQGVHKMYVEVKDNSGRWSLYDEKNVQIIGGVQMATLNAFEYFYDDDPGFGQGIQVAVNGQNINADFVLSVAGLANGPHKMYIRVRDAENQWSLYTSHLIQVVGAVYEELIAAEYFFNNDPGFGQGIPIALSAFDVDENFDIDLSGLAKGVHELYIRVQDATGQWSLYAQHNIQVEGGIGYHEIVAAEYFFDDDPGFGNGFVLDVPTSVTSFDDEFAVSIPGSLSNGPHKMYIRVQDGSGQWSLYATQTIQVCQITIPAITITGNPCQDNAVALSVPNGYISYEWSTDQTSQSINVTESGTYHVTVNDADCATTVSVDVFFDELAPPLIEVTGDICEGDVQTLTVVGTYESIEWSNSLTSQSINVVNEGNYTVTVTEGGCEGSSTVFVDFTPIPDPEIVMTGNACEGNTISLSVANGFDDYDWSQGGQTSSINITSDGTYSVTVDENGCVGSDATTINFDQVPNPSIAIIGNGTCDGEITTLAVTESFDSYLWSNDFTSQSINVTSGGTYGVTVSNGDCSAFTSVEVEYFDTPDATITVSGSECTGSTQTLTVAAGYENYEWSTISFGNSISVTTEGLYSVEVSEGPCTATESVFIDFYNVPDATISVSGGTCEGDVQTLSVADVALSIEWSNDETDNTIVVSTSDTYSVIVSNGNCTATDQVDITFTPSPQPDIAVGGGQCVGETQTLDAGPGYDSYLWSTTEETQTIDVTQSDEYTVTVTDNGCEGQASVDVVFFFIPIPVITQNGNTLNCLQGGFTYQWYYAGNPISGATGQSYSASQSGLYTVAISDGTCEAESSEFNFIYDSVGEPDNLVWSIYPNPAKYVLFIKTNFTGNTQLDVHDATGRLCFSQTLTNDHWPLPTANFPNGFYNLTLKNNNQLHRHTFMVMH